MLRSGFRQHTLEPCQGAVRERGVAAQSLERILLTHSSEGWEWLWLTPFIILNLRWETDMLAPKGSISWVQLST